MYRASLRVSSIIAVGFALVCFAAQLAHTQTLTVLYGFTGGPSGAYPALSSMDAAGNLYGSTQMGGYTQSNCADNGCGLVFKLTHKNSGWVETVLYDFLGNGDGEFPQFGPTLAADGTLYGTTSDGGNRTCREGCGIIYKLQPPASFCRSVLCPWNETIVRTFTGESDGATPSSGVSFDSVGNLYGTTSAGGYLSGLCGSIGCGVVYKLVTSNGGWTENVLYAFQGATDGSDPQDGVVMDSAGNLFGTSYGPTQGGSPGAVYKLTPNGSGYTKSFYYVFPPGGSNGSLPSGLIIDSVGNLYGGTGYDGPQNGGTAYELSPGGSGPDFTLLYAFSGSHYTAGVNGPLTMDTAGNLYGVTSGDGQEHRGSVFKLTPSGGSWTFTTLHNFVGGADGANPVGPVLLDAQGNVYGAARSAGAYNYGTVFEITP
jgi:uncharacterized repeat protein (TIGR03803 family)